MSRMSEHRGVPIDVNCMGLLFLIDAVNNNEIAIESNHWYDIYEANAATIQ